jgi:hypothetical protein
MEGIGAMNERPRQDKAPRSLERFALISEGDENVR